MFVFRCQILVGNCRSGMRTGFLMRQQAVAAVQAKVLRLNSSAIASVTNGKVRSSLYPSVLLISSARFLKCVAVCVLPQAREHSEFS